MDITEDVHEETSVLPKPVQLDGDQSNSIEEQTGSLNLPKFQYTRDQLLAWKDVRCSRLRPSSMLREFESSEGIWDPERWFNSTVGDDGSSLNMLHGYNSHFTVGEKMYSRGRKPEWEVDDGGRRPVNKIINDKSLKPNAGDSDVVLMPQRNFSSGCYINNNDSQHRRDGRDQRFNQRVVGSGRIVDRFKGRSDDSLDGWIDRTNSSRTKGKMTDKRFESGSSNRSEYRPRKPTAEPSWYREGPASQNETIELRGFNDRIDDYHVGFERNKKFLSRSKEDKMHEEIEEEEEEKTELEHDKGTHRLNRNQKVDTNIEYMGERNKDVRIETSAPTKPSDDGTNEFDFDLFAKTVGNPINTESEVDSKESRFRQFFQTQTSQESISNGNNAQDKKASKLPPPPPIYGHSIEKFIDQEEEKKNFMNILQKAQISYQGNNVQHLRASSKIDGNNPQLPASLKDLESGIKAMLKVNGHDSSADWKNHNGPLEVFYGPIYNDNKMDPSPVPNKSMLLGHKPLPVGSKVTRVSDLESVLPECFVSNEFILSEKKNPEQEDMSAYNKLLGLISLKGPPNHSLANHHFHDAYQASASPNYPNHMGDSSLHYHIAPPPNSMHSSMTNDKRLVNSPTLRSSPIAFGTCPPTNLATPMPIHAGHLINQFVSNQGTKGQFNNIDPSIKFGPQNSIDHHPPKESAMTSQGMEKMHAAFLPTSVIRQMAQDKAGSSKIVPQDTMWTMFRSNSRENNVPPPVFQQPIYNSHPPLPGHPFSPHNHLQSSIPGMSVFSRPPQQPSVASFLHCLQQGRSMPQQPPQPPLIPPPLPPQQQHSQQQVLHPLFQQVNCTNVPTKRAIVKGANISSTHPLHLNQDHQNLSLGNHVALQPGHVLSNAQVDQPSPAAVIAALQQALISKRHNPNNSGFEGWPNRASSVNSSSVGRTPNQVKLQ